MRPRRQRRDEARAVAMSPREGRSWRSRCRLGRRCAARRRAIGPPRHRRGRAHPPSRSSRPASGRLPAGHRGSDRRVDTPPKAGAGARRPRAAGVARHHRSWPRIPGRAPTDPTRRPARRRDGHPSRPRSDSPRSGCYRGRDASGRGATGRVRRCQPRPSVRASRSVWRALRGRSRSAVLLWLRRRQLDRPGCPARTVPSQEDRQLGHHRPRPGTAGPMRVCRGSCATGTSICRPGRSCRRPPGTGWRRCLCRGPKQPHRIGLPSSIDVDQRGPRRSARQKHRAPVSGSVRGSVLARSEYHAASIL